ncbi:MAG: hypothetical protein QG613_738 [Pseudomonadota bacterium]|nr:hypothetical protein [Pseudomonadota bacterium]
MDGAGKPRQNRAKKQSGRDAFALYRNATESVGNLAATNGQLHAPYGFAREGSAYYLLSPIPLEQNEKYVRFHTWLMQEVSTGLSGVENAC